MPDLSKPLLLVFPFDLLSHYLRCIEVAKVLRRRYDIKFAHSDSYSTFVKEAGFMTFNCRNFESHKVMDSINKFDFSWLNKSDMEEVLLDQIKSINNLKPAFVLGDASPTLKMAAEKNGVRYISLINGYMSKYYAVVRKLSRTHTSYKFVKKLPEKYADFITKTAESIAFYSIHKPFKSLRKKYGLSGKRSYLDEIEGDLNLIADLDFLFPQKSIPENYKFIPPLFYHSNVDIKVVQKFNSNKKTIFVSMGSTGDWNKVIFLNNPYYSKYNIITAADTSVKLNASHILKESFISPEVLYPHVDLVICHGGNGTIYQALSFGIPVLCMPSHFEQEWNVHRLEFEKLGKFLDEMDSEENKAMCIEEWIEKKNTDLFVNVQNRILSEIKMFYEEGLNLQ